MTRAYVIQYCFKMMRKLHQMLERKSPSTTFYGVYCAKDNMDCFIIKRPITQRLQTILQSLQQLFAFEEE